MAGNNFFDEFFKNLFADRNSASNSKLAASNNRKTMEQIGKVFQQQQDAAWEDHSRRQDEDLAWDQHDQPDDDQIWAEHEFENDNGDYVPDSMENIIEYDDDDDVNDDDDDDDDFPEIGNKGKDFASKNYPVSLHLNDKDERRNHLEMSGRVLCKKYPGIDALDNSEYGCMQRLFEGVFPDGFRKTVYGNL